MGSSVLGYLDDVSHEALVGWVADQDNPGGLEPVICHGVNGETSAFYPTVARHDVCSALNATGRFGFAIPVAAIRNLGAVVTLTDRHGTVLHGGDQVRVPDARQEPAQPGQAWFVIHIQKTAGTSLREALSRAMRPGQVAFVYPDGFIGLLPQELAALPLPQRAGFRLVMGHVYYGIADLLPGRPEYVTFLRQPEARLRSHYFHHHSFGSVFHVDGVPVDLPGVVTGGLTDEFDNLMVRMIAGAGPDTVPLGAIGEADVEQALRHIRTRFRFVGLTERMDEHYAALCAAMGIEPGQVAVENTRKLADPSEVAALVDWDEAMHRNRFDAMLYERVQAEGLCGRRLVPEPAGRA